MRYALFLTAFALVTIVANAQKADFERPSSYNYKRGIELYQAQNYSEALEYMQRELEDNDKNGYAYNVLQDIYYRYEEYGKALTAANMASSIYQRKTRSSPLMLTVLEPAFILNWQTR